MSHKLLVKDARGERELLLIGSILVGRDPRCDISDADPLLSRRHVEFRVTDAGVVVRDLNSRNGMLVNGRKVLEAVLHPGDVVQIAHLAVTFLSAAAAMPISVEDVAAARTRVLASAGNRGRPAPDEDDRTTVMTPEAIAAVAAATSSPHGSLDRPRAKDNAGTTQAGGVDADGTAPLLPFAGLPERVPATGPAVEEPRAPLPRAAVAPLPGPGIPVRAIAPEAGDDPAGRAVISPLPVSIPTPEAPASRSGGVPGPRIGWTVRAGIQITGLALAAFGLGSLAGRQTAPSVATVPSPVFGGWVVSVAAFGGVLVLAALVTADLRRVTLGPLRRLAGQIRRPAPGAAAFDLLDAKSGRELADTINEILARGR